MQFQNNTIACESRRKNTNRSRILPGMYSILSHKYHAILSAVQLIKSHIRPIHQMPFGLATIDPIVVRCIHHPQCNGAVSSKVMVSCQMEMAVAADGVTTHSRGCSNVTCADPYTQEYCKSASGTMVGSATFSN